ncbi:hypothetical protein GE09DRAFT_663067 [Coniochaeta sp. 2T2.1]|nr:hypothetical protein GE09DRAFT_663067 [Coniochaeta sp. 2T2.1]
MSRKPTDVPAPPPSLRALLPAHPQSRGPELPQRHVELKRKRQAAACETCREHKTKCDGNRPSCTACLRRGSECKFEAGPKETHSQALKRKFDSLQGKASSLQQVYDLLRTRPEDEAWSIFRWIRDGESPESILQFVHHGDLLLQLSLLAETGPQTDRFTSTSDAVTSPSHSETHSPYLSTDMSSVASTQSHSRRDSFTRRNSTETDSTDISLARLSSPCSTRSDRPDGQQYQPMIV